MKKKKDTSPRVPQRDKLTDRLEIKPFTWTQKQSDFLKLALDKQSKIIFVSGPAGSSKTLLATFASLQLINERRLSDIVYIRSAVESADSKLGFLPGEVEDKMAYYGIPFMDKLDELLPKSDIQSLIKDHRIDIQPVNFVRGQNWNARAIIVDEAQNLTQNELVTVLTRIGKFSKCFVLADPEQSDLHMKSGAFTKVSGLFSDDEAQKQGVFHFELNEEDIMRSDLCRFLVKRFKELPKMSTKQ